MKDNKPYNPPGKCEKCGGFFRIPMHAPVNTNRCECKSQQAKPMKDKFKEAITSEIDKLRFTKSWIEEIKDNINTLHQQAMKEAIEQAVKEEQSRHKETIKRIHEWIKSDNCWIEDEKGEKLPNAVLCGDELYNIVTKGGNLLWRIKSNETNEKDNT